MKSQILSDASEHEMRLVQLGAKVEQITSRLCYVTFLLEGIEIQYVYNINKKDEYYLERVKPYPLALKTLASERDLIKTIEIDLAQFKNAVKSHQINDFVTIGNNLNLSIKKFEDLFLYYNISAEACAVIQDKIDALIGHIHQTKEEAERVFFEKEPDNL